MNIKIFVGMLLSLCMVLGVLAIITPTNPTTDDMTNANTYDFTAVSDNPFAAGGLHIDLDFDGAKIMTCAWNGIDYDCELLAVDISALEGIYPVTMTDTDGPLVIGNLTIDHLIYANDFGFSASGNDVSYTAGGCVDTVSGVAMEQAEYSIDNFVADVNNFTANPETLLDGTYQFRGYCLDNIGNENYTSTTEFTLPASPPDLTEVIHLPITAICGTPPVFPCNESLDGSGLPLDVSLKLSFDKLASVTVALNDGPPIGPSGFYMQHVVTINSLTEGQHTLDIGASDGSNSANYEIGFSITNTGGIGNITIDVRGSIPVNVTEPAIEFLGTPIVEKDQVLPGDFAVVRYSLFMVKGEYTRFSFIGDVAFDSPITVFCDNNYNSTVQDIINPLDPNVFTIDDLDGTINETKNAITCPYTGSVDGGLVYDVITKYPIAIDAPSGPLAGSLNVGLYNTSMMP